MTVIYTTELCLSGMNSRIIKYGAMIHSIWTDYAFNNACHRQFSGMAYYYRQVHVYTIKGTYHTSTSMTIPRCSGHRPNLLFIRIWTNERPSQRHDVVTTSVTTTSRHRVDAMTTSDASARMKGCTPGFLVLGWGFGVLARGVGYLPVGGARMT